ncbi:MAG: hypothetical protein P1U34_05415 [Coxiellaceae bacterium]|nr:hypothetical protein [Coxiellaceae bacterium]
MRRAAKSAGVFISLLSNISLAHSLSFYLRERYDLNDADLSTTGFLDQLQLHLKMISPEKPDKNRLKLWCDSWCQKNTELLAPYKLERPERTIHRSDKRIRRLDHLAKLLAPNEEISPCLAVAITARGIIVSSNRTRRPSEYKKSTIHSFVENRLHILRELFYAYYDCKDATIRESLLQQAARDLEATGGICNLTVSDTKKRRHPTHKQLDNLVSILRKVTLSVLKESEATAGFTDVEKYILSSAKPAIFLYPDEIYEKEVGGSLHAEQVLVHFIEADGAHEYFYEPLPIGITKLACSDCDRILRAKPYIAFRGSHGMSYPGVVDTNTSAVASGAGGASGIKRKVSRTGETLPDDSDSSGDDEDSLYTCVTTTSTSVSSSSSTPSSHPRPTRSLRSLRADLSTYSSNMFHLMYTPISPVPNTPVVKPAAAPDAEHASEAITNSL